MNGNSVINSAEETREYMFYCMEQLIVSDNQVTEEEKDLLDSVKALLRVSKSCNVQPESMTLDEQVFLVKELFRLSIADMNYHESEAELIKEIVWKNGINDVIYFASEKWAKKQLEAENEYLDELAELV